MRLIWPHRPFLWRWEISRVRFASPSRQIASLISPCWPVCISWPVGGETYWRTCWDVMDTLFKILIWLLALASCNSASIPEGRAEVARSELVFVFPKVARIKRTLVASSSGHFGDLARRNERALKQCGLGTHWGLKISFSCISIIINAARFDWYYCQHSLVLAFSV